MLTRKQKNVLEVLKNFVRKNGYFPTVRQIAFQMKLSSLATVQSYLYKLFEKGYLRKIDRIWEISPQIPVVPLIGYVPAGSPDEIFENLGEEVELPEWMIDQEGDILGFRVKGHSMIDAYIQDGDIVVVKRVSTAEPGEMVVALLEDSSITLKRLRKSGDNYWLSPENPEYPQIDMPFQVIGKVIGVLRKYK